MKNEKYFKEGTYVVSLKNTVAGIGGFNKGEIARIISDGIKYKSEKWSFNHGSKYEKDREVKWFETLEEAEAFSKSLFPSSIPPSIPETKTFADFGINPEMEYEATIINSWQSQGANSWSASKGYWENDEGWCFGNRKLSRLELKGGIWALYVEGTLDVFIRAEGFIEYYRAELLKMAIQNYPIGTKYSSAFDRTADGECTMTPYWSGDDAINGGSRYIWFKGKWGKILDVPTEKNEEPVDKGWFDKEPPVEEEFKIGDVVTITSWHFGEIPLPQKGVIKSISRDLVEPYGILISKGSPDINTGTWWFKPGQFVKGFTENTTVEHSNAVEQEEAIPELTHNIKPNSINNNLKSTTAVVGTIKQKSKTIKF